MSVVLFEFGIALHWFAFVEPRFSKNFSLNYFQEIAKKDVLGGTMFFVECVVELKYQKQIVCYGYK